MRSLNDRDRRRYGVASLCRLFGVSKQAYYKAPRGSRELSAQTEACVAEFVRAERSVDATIGCRKLWIIYNREKPRPLVSRGMFESVVTRHGLWLRKRRKSTRTTDSRHGFPVYPNLVYALIPTAPCQIWVADITYIAIANGSTRFCYLSLIMDAYSRYILGYCVGATLETVYSTMALDMAIKTYHRLKLPLHELIHHSDRSVQYASTDYTGILKAMGIKISMTENGNPKDNPQAERVNSTIKNELFGKKDFRSLSEVRAELPNKVEYYNHRRPHMSIGNKTPLQALPQTGEIEKKWHSYRDDAIRALNGFLGGVGWGFVIFFIILRGFLYDML